MITTTHPAHAHTPTPSNIRTFFVAPNVLAQAMMEDHHGYRGVRWLVRHRQQFVASHGLGLTLGVFRRHLNKQGQFHARVVGWEATE